MAYSNFRPRRDTSINWTAVNPVLLEGEIGYEVPSAGVGKGLTKMKIGDGLTPWNELPYAIAPELYANEADVSGFATNEELGVVRNTATTAQTKAESAITKATTLETNLNQLSAKHTNEINQINAVIGSDWVQTGVAVDSEGLGGLPASSYGRKTDSITTYTYAKNGTTHGLINTSGSNNIKFIPNQDYVAGDVFTVNGVGVTAQLISGEPLPDGYFKSGSVVICYLNGDVLNFNVGGGLSNSKLAEATATEADVLIGKSFFSGDKEIKTGNGQVYTYVNKVASAELRTDTYTLSAGTYRCKYTGGGYFSKSVDTNTIEFYINDVKTSVSITNNKDYSRELDGGYDRWFDRYFDFTLENESNVYFVYPKKDGRWQIFISTMIFKIG